MNPRAQAAYDERRIEVAEADRDDRYVDDDEGFARRVMAREADLPVQRRWEHGRWVTS